METFSDRYRKNRENSRFRHLPWIIRSVLNSYLADVKIEPDFVTLPGIQELQPLKDEKSCQITDQPAD